MQHRNGIDREGQPDGMGSVERWRADAETTADCLEQGDATGSHLSGSRFRPPIPKPPATATAAALELSDPTAADRPGRSQCDRLHASFR